MRVVIALVLACLLLPWAMSVAGDVAGKNVLPKDIVTSVPRSMNYQGIVKDSDGDPVPESFFDVYFSLFDADEGGTELWSQMIHVGTDANGIFTATFSNVNLPFDADYWLQLQIDGIPLLPRQKLAMVPYSAVSDTSDYATHALNADMANNAAVAANADHAMMADHAGMADMAANADMVDMQHAGDFAPLAHGHDDQYVNEGQSSSVTGDMIVDGTISFVDIGQNGANPGQVMKWNGSAWSAGNDSVGSGAALSVIIWSGGCSHHGQLSGFNTYCTDVVDFNTAVDYLSVNPNGTITVLRSGYYRISASTMCNMSSEINPYVVILKNATQIHMLMSYTPANLWSAIGADITYPFSAGDIMKVQYYNPLAAGNYAYIMYSPGSGFGHLQVIYLGPL